MTKRPSRSIYATWKGGSSESRQAEQDAIDLAVHGDNFPGWIRATIEVDGSVRRVSSTELFLIGGVGDERLARYLVAGALRKAGLSGE